jgi:hypothetical protein
MDNHSYNNSTDIKSSSAHDKSVVVISPPDTSEERNGLVKRILRYSPTIWRRRLKKAYLAYTPPVNVPVYYLGERTDGQVVDVRGREAV